MRQLLRRTYLVLFLAVVGAVIFLIWPPTRPQRGSRSTRYAYASGEYVPVKPGAE